MWDFTLESKDFRYEYTVKVFLEKVKKNIPKEYRTYDDDSKIWSIHRDYWLELAEILTHCFGYKGGDGNVTF